MIYNKKSLQAIMGARNQHNDNYHTFYRLRTDLHFWPQYEEEETE